MVRKGRDLEQLIAHLEKCLSSTVIQITSPDFIEDKITGEKREVDISLKTIAGSSKILIILECRDRRSKEDVTWIEQLATKRDDIGAHNAIAVSSKGFSDGAKAKARLKNIELRTLKEITLKDIDSWFRVKSLKSRKFFLSNPDIQMFLRYPRRDERKVNKFLNKLNLSNNLDQNNSNQKIFLDMDTTTPLSLNDLLLAHFLKKYEGQTNVDRNKRIKTGILYPKDKKIGFLLLVDEKRIPVNSIKYTVGLEIKDTESGIQSVKSYKSDDGTLADIIRFEHSDQLAPEHSFEMVSIPEGKGRKIGLRIVDTDQKIRKMMLRK